MKKNDIYELPENIHQFGFIPKFSEVISALSKLAEPEDWEYHNTNGAEGDETELPILENYLKYTYKRIAEEKKVSFSTDDSLACFNTGLVTGNQEAIFMVFSENKIVDTEPYWHFSKFLRRGEYELSRFPQLPEMAFYLDDPSRLVYDFKKELISNIEHIIEDNKDRFPAPFNSMSNHQLQNTINGAIQNAKERVKRNYKTAVPQYYRNKVQLLIPLCLTDPKVADLALVVEDYGHMYRASTCISLDMAINNARTIAKPDRDWLQP